MKKITLENDFHNTSINLMVGDDNFLSKSQMNRARRALCGIDGCTCSGCFGTRGVQPNGIYIDVWFDNFGNPCGGMVVKN